jgi:hypothetical protein
MSNNKRIFIVVDEALHIARLLDDHVVVCTDDVAPARPTARDFPKVVTIAEKRPLKQTSNPWTKAEKYKRPF